MWNLDTALITLLELTKLHSTISQVINTQHGLRPLLQRVVYTGKLSAASERLFSQAGIIELMS